MAIRWKVKGLDYRKCQELLKGARNGRRKLGHNTWLVPSQDYNNAFGVILHATEIITIHEDGLITYQTGGWESVTTKDRLSNLGPQRVYQKNHVWYLADGRKFEEGIDARVQLPEAPQTDCLPEPGTCPEYFYAQ